MTLAAKGSRLITVDGHVYRWRVRRKPTYSQGIEQSPLTFALQLAEDPGSTLVVRMPQSHPGNWLGTPAKPVLPSDVERAVHAALAAGWVPADRGPVFALDFSAEDSA